MTRQKNQLLKKIWHWIKVASLLFTLIGSGYLIYQRWNRKQELAKLQAQLEQREQETHQQYQLQKEHLISLTELAGLYADPQTGNGYGEMGRCFTEKVIYTIKQKEANISLNRLYLLNKFDQKKYFTNNPQLSNDYSYLDISFNKMIETCCHEIAHYLQFVKYGKSSCESDLMLNNGKYDGELAKEHKEFTQEIYGMVKNSGEYLEWERRWKKIT